MEIPRRAPKEQWRCMLPRQRCKLSGKRIETGQRLWKASIGHRRSKALRFPRQRSVRQVCIAVSFSLFFVWAETLISGLCVCGRKVQTKGGHVANSWGAVPLSSSCYTIVTNNPKVAARWPQASEWVDGGARAVLVRARGLVHLGHRLLTHPLAGSVKPNESPYRSVIVSQHPDAKIDFDSLRIIEGAVAVVDKFGPPRYCTIPLHVDADFQLIDCTLMESAVESLRAQYGCGAHEICT